MKVLLFLTLSILLNLSSLAAQNRPKHYDKTKVLALQFDFAAAFFGEVISVNIEPSLTETTSFNLKGGLTATDIVYNTFFVKETEFWASDKSYKLGYHLGLSYRKYIGDTEVFDGVFFGPSVHYKEFNSISTNHCRSAIEKPFLYEKRRVFDTGIELGFAFLLKSSFLTEIVVDTGVRNHFINGEACLVSAPFRVHLDATSSWRIVPYFKMGIRMGFVLLVKGKKPVLVP